MSINLRAIAAVVAASAATCCLARNLFHWNSVTYDEYGEPVAVAWITCLVVALLLIFVSPELSASDRRLKKIATGILICNLLVLAWMQL